MTTQDKATAVLSAAKNTNISAVKTTAMITSGKALNAAVKTKITPKLPMMVRGYADTTLGAIVMANIVASGLKMYAPTNPKAALIGEAMVTAAMVDFAASFDIEGMVREFLASPEADSLVAKLEE